MTVRPLQGHAYDAVPVSATSPSRVARDVARDVGLDVARGIAMIMVVLGHAIYGVKDSGMGNHLYRFELLALYTTHMALFFILAGLLAGSIRTRSWPEFARMALIRVVWPYILWSLVLKAAHFIMADFVNSPSEGFQAIKILWMPPAVMWFLYALLVGMILLKLTAPLSRAASLGIAAALVLGAYLAPDALPEWIANALRFIGLYMAAALFGLAGFERLLAPRWVWLSGAVMGATLLYAWIDANDLITGYAAFEAVYIPAMLAGPVLLVRLSRWIVATGLLGGLTRAMAAVGRRTMPIFVIHVLITAGVRIVLLQLGLTDGAMIILLATLLGTVLPLIAARISDRLHLSPVLGWR